MLPSLRSDPIVRMLGHTTVVLALLTIAYYLLPLRIDANGRWTGELAVSLVALAILAVMFRREITRSSRAQGVRYQRIQWLLTALYVLVLFFALLYAFTATVSPSQFVGINDRTDALYFSVTVVATVGFGDIHANANAAKLLVTVHMLFNLIYLGTALRLLTSSSTIESRRRDGD